MNVTNINVFSFEGNLKVLNDPVRIKDVTPQLQDKEISVKIDISKEGMEALRKEVQAMPGHIDFEKHFHAVPNLQVTILNKAQGDDEFITNLDATGFDICLKNVELPITKTINFVAQGY